MVINIKIISHRGNDNNEKKENIIDALISSLNKDYIDGIEFDIRKTKDNKFVISHSPFYNLELIKNKKRKELKLDNLNKLLKQINNKKIILIEIKEETDNYKKLIYYLNKILKKYKYLNIYICSFNYDLIKEIKQNYNYKCGLIISNILNRNKDYKIFDFISVKYNMENKYKDKELMLWTINNKDNIKKYKNKNLYIITDKPYLIKEI